MAMTVAEENANSADVRALVDALSDHLLPLSPPEFQFGLTLDEMVDPAVFVFVARAAGEPIGCGALKVHGNALGEIKRMYTTPEARGTGAGRKIVEAIEAKARALGLVELKLETGPIARFEGAHRLYTRCGYAPCPAYLDYPESEHSAFFAKTL